MKYSVSVILLIMLCVLPPICVFADVQLIDTAMIRIRYDKIELNDTVKRDSLKYIMEVTLFAGKKGSAFYSTELRTDDEMPHDVAWVEYHFGPDRNKHKTRGQMEKEKVFRFYDKNLTIEHLFYDISHWELKEEIEKPVWEIQDSTMNILGFDCVKAVTDFRGRRWIAWFAPEIPIPEGPWKLFGIPGIILRAYDSRHHYTYEAREIDTTQPGLVEFFDYNPYRFTIRDRRKGLMNRRKTLYSDVVKTSRARLGDIIPKDFKRKPAPNRYDFQETDYEHVPIETYKR